MAVGHLSPSVASRDYASDGEFFQVTGMSGWISNDTKLLVTSTEFDLERLMTRTALVTGGTRGIGAAIAKKLQDDGFVVAVSYAGNSEAAAAFSRETGIEAYKWDVADYDASAAGIAQVEADIGPIDVVVANAGITRDAPFHKMTPEQWHQVIDTNLTGVFNTVHPIWPGMRERKFGRVIVISSVNGQKGQFAQVNYAATKAGDLGIVKSLAQEGARAGITANAVCPGYIATEMVMAVPEKVRESIIAQIPAGRLGEPEEIARCVAFLASDDAQFINGSTLSANGAQFVA
jgi:acetoacetyl-CoA reductase